MDRGRVIIDPHTYGIYSTPGPGLGSIESDLPMSSADEESHAEAQNVVYKATAKAYQKYQSALQKCRKSGKVTPLGDRKRFLHPLISIRTVADIRFS